jgi:hypothetical protein
MSRHTLENVVEPARQAKDDMTSGQSRIRKKHQDSTTSSSSTSSSSSSSNEGKIKSRKDKKMKKVWDKGQAEAGEEKTMEEEKLLLVEN